MPTCVTLPRNSLLLLPKLPASNNAPEAGFQPAGSCQFSWLQGHEAFVWYIHAHAIGSASVWFGAAYFTATRLFTWKSGSRLIADLCILCTLTRLHLQVIVGHQCTKRVLKERLTAASILLHGF